MSSSFDDRKRQEEAKYQHDEELRFKIRNRRNKLFGLHVAELLGLQGEEAEVYAKELVLAAFERPSDADILAKAKADLAANGVEVSDHSLHKRLEAVQEAAKQQIMAQ
jgi:hypothetical protein